MESGVFFLSRPLLPASTFSIAASREVRLERPMTIVRDSFYINGEWVKAASPETLEVTTSGTGALYATCPAGTVEQADRAVEAAAAAFPAWSNTSPKERGEFLMRISEKLAERDDELSLIIANEGGMPLMLTKGIQVP